jgi:hypothetical protein
MPSGRESRPSIRGRKEFGRLKSDQMKRLKDLERENARRCKAIADLWMNRTESSDRTRQCRSPSVLLRHGRGTSYLRTPLRSLGRLTPANAVSRNLRS